MDQGGKVINVERGRGGRRECVGVRGKEGSDRRSGVGGRGFDGVGGEGEEEDGCAGGWLGREMEMCRRMYVLMCLIVILNGKWGGGDEGF